MVVYSWPPNAKTLLGRFCNSNCIHRCSHIMLSFSSNMNIVEWFVSMLAVRLFVGSALTISFGLACRGYTCSRHFMVCTCMTYKNSHLLGISHAKKLYHIKKTRNCWESSMQMSSLKKSTDAKTTCIYAHKIHYCLWKKSKAESNMQSASLATKREKRLDSVKA